MALDATIGGANANSYQDRTEASLYFADRLYADTWNSASNGDKDIALIMACRRMETEEYVGRKATTTQALKWPRVNYSGVCSYYAFEDLNGNGYASGVIPKPVRYAQSELALAFLQSNVLGSGNALSGAGLEALDLGPIKLDFGSGSSALTGQMPVATLQYLRGLLITSAQIVRA